MSSSSTSSSVTSGATIDDHGQSQSDIASLISLGNSRWFFNKDKLEQTPSRKYGIDPDRELGYRQQCANLIQDMGQRLQVNQLCINTAIVYMHRFYMYHSFTQFNRNQMSTASIFLAAKVEEQPRKLEHIIKVSHYCLNRETNPPIDLKSDQYKEQSAELVMYENILLQTLGFDVGIDHPHTHVVKCCQLVRASKDLAQTSYFMATNSLHLTTMSLQYKPTVVACVCIHLACKWSSWEIPRSKEGKDWFSYVDDSVTLEQLETITNEFLNIFNKSPSRLKKKILSLSQQSGGHYALTSFPSHISLDPSKPLKPPGPSSPSPKKVPTTPTKPVTIVPKHVKAHVPSLQSNKPPIASGHHAASSTATANKQGFHAGWKPPLPLPFVKESYQNTSQAGPHHHGKVHVPPHVHPSMTSSSYRSSSSGPSHHGPHHSQTKPSEPLMPPRSDAIRTDVPPPAYSKALSNVPSGGNGNKIPVHPALPLPSNKPAAHIQTGNNINISTGNVVNNKAAPTSIAGHNVSQQIKKLPFPSECPIPLKREREGGDERRNHVLNLPPQPPLPPNPQQPPVQPQLIVSPKVSAPLHSQPPSSVPIIKKEPLPVPRTSSLFSPESSSVPIKSEPMALPHGTAGHIGHVTLPSLKHQLRRDVTPTTGLLHNGTGTALSSLFPNLSSASEYSAGAHVANNNSGGLSTPQVPNVTADLPPILLPQAAYTPSSGSTFSSSSDVSHKKSKKAKKEKHKHKDKEKHKDRDDRKHKKDKHKDKHSKSKERHHSPVDAGGKSKIKISIGHGATDKKRKRHKSDEMPDITSTGAAVSTSYAPSLKLKINKEDLPLPFISGKRGGSSRNSTTSNKLTPCCPGFGPCTTLDCPHQSIKVKIKKDSIKGGG